MLYMLGVMGRNLLFVIDGVMYKDIRLSLFTDTADLALADPVSHSHTHIDGWRVDGRGWLGGWVEGGWVEGGWVAGWRVAGWLGGGWMVEGWLGGGWMVEGWLGGWGFHCMAIQMYIHVSWRNLLAICEYVLAISNPCCITDCGI